MFVKNVYSFRNLPVEEKERMWTDCCCTIIGAVFALTLFIIACVSFNQNNFLQVNFPVETSGKLCYYDLPNQPFIYFRIPNNSAVERYCVAQCPSTGQSIQCAPGANCVGIVSTYSTSGILNGLGGICQPTNPATRATFWQDPGLSNKYGTVRMWDVTLWSLLISACVGLLYMILFIIVPKIMTYAVFVLCALTLLISGILLLVQPMKILAFHNNVWNIVIGIILILVAIVFVAFLFCQRQEIEVGAIFLATSNTFLKQKAVLFALIPLFMLFSFGLVVLCTWQYIGIASASPPYWNPSMVYKTIQYSVILQVLNVIEFIWGVQFIRDAFNYIISGNAVEWYFNNNGNQATNCCRPFTRLLCRNFGSVVAGSFLNAFLNLLCLIFDFFRCDPKGKCGRATKCCHEVCCCCFSVFDLARADAYAYIHLSGIPFCNAARQCQAICQNTYLFSSDDTCIRLYRIAAQIFVVTLSVLITMIVFRAKTNYVSMFGLAVVIMFCYLTATHFVDIHSNAAEGLVTCYLTEANCEGQQGMDACPQHLRNDIYNFQKKYDLIPEWTV